MGRSVPKIDRTGELHGRWTILGWLPPPESGLTVEGTPAGGWLCRCECGTERVLKSRFWDRSFSCGCIRFKLEPRESALRNLECVTKHRASKGGLTWELSRDAFRALVVMPCVYCGIHPANVSSRITPNRSEIITYSGIDRVDSTQGYIDTNVVPCCSYCNRAKCDYSKEEFLVWAIRVNKHLSQGDPAALTPETFNAPAVAPKGNTRKPAKNP